MSGKPTEPVPTGTPHGVQGTDIGEHAPHERTGPLDVERLTKDDGRAIILYTATTGHSDA